MRTDYQPIPGPEEIVIGRDGVLLRKEGHSAVYLPQVAVEQGWNKEETLDHLCVKAGLSEGCWRTNTQLYIFQSEIFDESEFDLPVPARTSG